MKGGIDDVSTVDMMLNRSESNSLVTGVQFLSSSLLISAILLCSSLFLALSCCRVSFTLDGAVIEIGAFNLAGVSSCLDFCLKDLCSALNSFVQKLQGESCSSSGNNMTRHDEDLAQSFSSNGLLQTAA